MCIPVSFHICECCILDNTASCAPSQELPKKVQVPAQFAKLLYFDLVTTLWSVGNSFNVYETFLPC